MGAYVALLYSVVLGGGRRVVMADLREMAEQLGLGKARTLVATGNLVFDAPATVARALEVRLEGAFVARFGRRVDFIVRSAVDWRRLIAGNPFPESSRADPARVVVRVMRAPLAPGALDRLAPYRSAGEEMAVVGGDLWLCLPRGVSQSRLVAAITPARIGVGTFRNWNTVRRLGAMLDA